MVHDALIMPLSQSQIGVKRDHPLRLAQRLLHRFRVYQSLKVPRITCTCTPSLWTLWTTCQNALHVEAFGCLTTMKKPVYP